MISKKDLSFYKSNGYLLVKNVLKKEDFEQIDKTLKKMEKLQSPGRGLSEPGIKKSLIHSLHKNQNLIETIEKKIWFQSISKILLKTDQIKVWNAKSNLKKRWAGSVEYYHQDYIYWRELGFNSSDMINCMIFIDDHTHTNGGLWVFQGSHKKMFKHSPFLNINSLQKYFIHPSLLDKISKKMKPISISGKKGSCLFFHSKLIHGSAHNISPNDRRILLYDISTKKHFENANKNKINSFNRDFRKKFEKKILLQRIKALK